jgi:hypothetical protein
MWFSTVAAKIGNGNVRMFASELPMQEPDDGTDVVSHHSLEATNIQFYECWFSNQRQYAYESARGMSGSLFGGFERRWLRFPATKLRR